MRSGRWPARCATATSAAPMRRSLRVVFDELVVRVVAGLGAGGRGPRRRRGPGDDRADERGAGGARRRRPPGTPRATAAGPRAARRRPAHPRTRAGPGDAAAARRRPVVAGRASRPVSAGRSRRARRRPTGRRSSRGSSPAAAPSCSTTTSCWRSSTRWIASLRADTFETVVALLRRTFGAFEPAERRQLGALLATGQVERVAPMGDDVDEARARAGLATVRAMLGLPGAAGGQP